MLVFFILCRFNKPHLNDCLVITIIRHHCLIYIIIFEILKCDNACVSELMKYYSLIPCSASNLLIIWLHMKLRPLPNPFLMATLVIHFTGSLEIKINLQRLWGILNSLALGKWDLQGHGSITNLHLACINIWVGLSVWGFLPSRENRTPLRWARRMAGSFWRNPVWIPVAGTTPGLWMDCSTLRYPHIEFPTRSSPGADSTGRFSLNFSVAAWSLLLILSPTSHPSPPYFLLWKTFIILDTEYNCPSELIVFVYLWPSLHN